MMLGLPNSPELLGPEFKTSGAHFKHFEGVLHFHLRIDPICLCPETSAAHPSLTSSTQSSGRSGVLF